MCIRDRHKSSKYEGTRGSSATRRSLQETAGNHRKRCAGAQDLKTLACPRPRADLCRKLLEAVGDAARGPRI
eukprot:15472938-Alexandrium_andersonii.AAC.1